MKLEIKDPTGRVIQTLHLADGEYTLSVTGAATETHKRAGLPTQTIVLGAICALTLFASQYLVSGISKKDSVDSIRQVFESFVVIVVGILALSSVARALTHKFQIWQSANLVFTTVLGSFALSQNLFGLRWMLPKIFWYRELYQFLQTGFYLYILWLIMKVLFIHLSVTWRKGIVSALACLAVAYTAANYLPFRKEYRFLTIQTPPPRLEAVESSPLTLDSFISLLGED